jgi:hypothetical protein
MALFKLTSPLCIIACSASTFVHVQQRSRLTERLDRRVEIDGDYFGAERAIAPSTVGWGAWYGGDGRYSAPLSSPVHEYTSPNDSFPSGPVYTMNGTSISSVMAR